MWVRDDRRGEYTEFLCDSELNARHFRDLVAPPRIGIVSPPALHLCRATASPPFAVGPNDRRVPEIDDGGRQMTPS